MKGFFTDKRRELIARSFVNNIVPIILAATFASDFFTTTTIKVKIITWLIIIGLFAAGIVILPPKDSEKESE